MTFIYALCEPRTRKIRYIGKADNVHRRLGQHLSDSRRLETHLGHWIRSLNGVPTAIILARVSEGDWQAEEARYIQSARVLGIRLVNSTDGGEGLINPSPETRKKMRKSKLGPRCHWFGKKRTLAEREKIRAAKLGPKNPNFGKHPSDETRRKQSKSHLGKKFSRLHRLRLSRSVKRSWKLRK